MTQAILLGAGQSSRMDAERGGGPKWMLEVSGLSLAQHLVNALHQCDVTEIILARGMLGGTVPTPSVAYRDVHNSRNMLETLYSVRDDVRDDVVVLYCDLMVEPRLVAALLNASGEVAVAVDRSWHNLFRLRANDPLRIAESCRIESGLIKEIGQPLRPSEFPEAQYIGMMRFSGKKFGELMTLYESLTCHFSGKPWRNAKIFEGAFMTDFLQECVDRGMPLDAVEVEGGWLEFDTPRDFLVARELLATPRPEVFQFGSLLEHASVISSGGVTVRGEGEEREVLLVGTGEAGEWRVPKGMLEPGENVRSGACREVAEETGIRIAIEGFAGIEEWVYTFGERQWHERCYFYRMSQQDSGEPRPDTENAVAAWVPISAGIQGMKYEQERNILRIVLAQG